MAEITLTHVDKRFDQTHVIRDVSLAIHDGEFCVLVGPSGSGKSTLLRIIAGLETLNSGQVHIGGRDVTHSAPKDRNIAMVFQSYALYPQMTVRENMGFGLKLLKCAPAEIQRRVDDAARMLGLEALMERRPAALSGGQRQRVAMGRAMVREPAAFLFDEPLSNLDAALRASVRGEIRAMHARLQTTSVYVTHDQVEAMTMGDRIVVLRAGQIEQVGTPVLLYEQPANRFVANFIGSPAMNFCTAPLLHEAGAHLLRLGDSALPLRRAPATSATSIDVGIRPEHVLLGAAPEHGPVLQAQVQGIEFLGAHSMLSVHTAAGALVVAVPERPALRVGDTTPVTVLSQRLHAFDVHSGLRLELGLAPEVRA
jgi:multiple sugar transport system ATP-binding protein